MPPQILLLASFAFQQRRGRHQPHLKPVPVSTQRSYIKPEKRLMLSTFPTTAIVSLVVGLSNGLDDRGPQWCSRRSCRGSAALNGKISLNRSIVQVGVHRT